MTDLRRIFTVLSLLLLAGVCFSAESKHSVVSPLAISGEVREARLDNNRAAGEMVIDVSMTLHFKNNSSRPLLVFISEGWPWLGGQNLASSREDALSNRYVYVSGAWPSSNRPAWEEARRKLDQKYPPKDLIHEIGPGSTWNLEKAMVLGIEKKGSFDGTSKPWDAIKKADPVWLQLKFMLWPNNLEQNIRYPEFGRRLQRRWRNQGQLIIDEVVSDPISLNLPVE